MLRAQLKRNIPLLLKRFYLRSGYGNNFLYTCTCIFSWHFVKMFVLVFLFLTKESFLPTYKDILLNWYNFPYLIDIHFHSNLQNKHIGILVHQTPFDIFCHSGKGCLDRNSETDFNSIKCNHDDWEVNS